MSLTKDNAPDDIFDPITSPPRRAETHDLCGPGAHRRSPIAKAERLRLLAVIHYLKCRQTYYRHLANPQVDDPTPWQKSMQFWRQYHSRCHQIVSFIHTNYQ